MRRKDVLMEKNLRIKDIEQLISGLDISPTMHRNATEKYENVAKYFETKGIHCDVFPLGSFSLGTVVRPYYEMKDADYDLDFIACLHHMRNDDNIEAKSTKMAVGDSLKENEIYNQRLEEEWEKCWTLNYAEIDGIGFNMDIIPAVIETNDKVRRLVNQGLSQVYTEKVVAITNKIAENDYRWITINPKAYKKWFMEINSPFAMYNREMRLDEIMQRSKRFYGSIEEIPLDMERSALQRVIQLLKRHRDIYFSKAGTVSKDKPISVIVTTLAAEIAKNAPANISVYDLFIYVVNEISLYSDYRTLNEAKFFDRHGDYKKLIQKPGGNWAIMNPVNPEDNLADGWNMDDSKANAFFRWIKQLRVDFIDSLEFDDEKFAVVLGNSFGNDYYAKSGIREKYQISRPAPISNKPKHWGLL